jgi:uncharacterized protein
VQKKKLKNKKIDIIPIANAFKTALQNLYGNDLNSLYLFGSFARGDYDDDSDIDFLVVLNHSEIKKMSEISKMSDITSTFWQNYNRLFSVVPAAKNKFDSLAMPLYENIKREGIKL